MDIIDNTSHKFERKFTDFDTYQVKITTELLEELQNCQNLDEITLDIKENSGTFTIPSSKNKKVFDLNIGSIPRGEKESFEVNKYRSNKTVESLGSLQVRLNIQATSKVYDMTKKKISEVEDESKKHCAKELKMEKFSNKQGLAYKMIQKNKEARKSESISNTNRPYQLPPNPNEKKLVVDQNQFTLRQKILHLLALEPLNRNTIGLKLLKMKVNHTDRTEIDKCLSQLATINKDGKYQLSNQFIPEIQEDWPYFTSEDIKKVLKLKMDSKTPTSNRIPLPTMSRHSAKPITPDSHENTRPKLPSAPHPPKTKITALDMINKKISYTEISKTLNVPEHVIHLWKTQEHQIRQSFQNDRRSSDFPSNKYSVPTGDKTISPVNRTDKSQILNNADEDSNCSSKTHTSNDEGFVSGDKPSPLLTSYQKHVNLKRRSQHLDEKEVDKKKLHLTTNNIQHEKTHNDNQSSSSCEVTPKSDISHSSRSSLQNDNRSDKSIPYPAKTNPNVFETQKLFNASFEEYRKLCEKVKECESKIENLRSKCINGTEDYSKIYKLAKLLLAEMEKPKFQEITARIKKLELDMRDYMKILNV